MQLYNKLNTAESAKLIDEIGKERTTMSFYKYHKIENPQAFRNDLFLEWDAIGVLGRTYVSYEGINAQISVPTENLSKLKKQLYSISFLKDVIFNIAIEQNNKSFLKLKIKVRNKIVSDGLSDESFDITDTGKHLQAKEFNEMIRDPNTICIDMRNHYENEIGYFKGAIRPDVDTFRDSLDIIEKELKNYKEDKNLLMYCTGGIRCEKASAYYKHKGFKNIFQLKGGIIQYTHQVKKEGLENKFLGKNFVFDHRLSERISEDVVSNCHQCGVSCDTHVNCKNESCNLLFIQCTSCSKKMNICCSERCKNIASLPFEKQKELRKGKGNSNKIFKKGRSEVLKFKK